MLILLCIKFIYVHAPHTADRLYIALVNYLWDWNIDAKLSTITLDNCSTNICMIDKIKDKLQLNTLIKEGSLLHMHCCVHILNLIVKKGFGVLKDEVENILDNIAHCELLTQKSYV